MTSGSDTETDFGKVFSQSVTKKSFKVPYSSHFQIPDAPDPPSLNFLSSQPVASQKTNSHLPLSQRGQQKGNHLENSFTSFHAIESTRDNLSDHTIENDDIEILTATPYHNNHVKPLTYSSNKDARRQLFHPADDDYTDADFAGSQTVANKRFTTPLKSSYSSSQRQFTLETPSNAAISVPAAGDANGNINLRSLSEIPEAFRGIFKFPYFNVVQSKVFDNVFYSDNSLVVCAPTGSGKTALLELAIVRMLLCNGGDANLEYKIVYMAPIKALCSERHQDWSTKFGSFGLKCTELTGDTDLDDFHVLQSSHVVLTTPEKWDSMTRKWKDHKSLVQSVRLFLIDEVHLLSDESRGATMEAVVSRMKTVQRFIKTEANKASINSQLMRIIAVSATIPNVDDIADWLTIDDCQAEAYSMGDEYRPVKLKKVVLGYPFSENSSDFKFDLSLNYKLSGIIQTYSECKPTIVFCSTRKGTCQAAATLTKDARFIMDAKHRGRLIRYSNSLHDAKLKDLVLYGVGYHHAGMDVADRKNIESMFVRGELPVLFCTTTLAMGVNLPAHLVIIKSTTHYIMGMCEEYSESQILQMIGRAGRPQFDTSATAVIMTKTSTKARYQSLISGMQKIESSLHRHLTEHVNAEIVLNTITSVQMTNEWLKSTFLYKRMQRNPVHYGAPEGLNEDALSKKLQAMGVRALRSLQSLDLLDIKENSSLNPTETGKLMARYCIAFDTVKSFSKLKGTEGLEDIVDILCKSKEFEDITLRTNEKRSLNTLNKDKNRATIRFPMKNKIKTTDQKINCLIQAVLGCLTVNEFSLTQDIAKIFRSAQRVSKFLTEYLFMKGFYKASVNAVILCKCIKARLWENSKFLSKQLDKIGSTMSAAMANAGLTSLDKIENTNPREIELIVNRHPPFGNQVKDSLAALPKYDISIDQDENYQENSADLYITVLMLNFELRANYLKNKKSVHQHSCLLLIGDASNSLVLKQRLMDSFFLQNGSWTKHIRTKRAQRSYELSVNLISSDYVGIDLQFNFTPRYTANLLKRHLEAKSSLDSAVQEKENVKQGNNDEGAKDEMRKTCTHRCINKNCKHYSERNISKYFDCYLLTKLDDQSTCGHQCCKYGVAIKQPRKTKENKVNSEAGINAQDLADGNGTIRTKTPKKESKRQATAMDGFFENLHEKSSIFPVTPGVKRIKVQTSLYDSIDLDDKDSDDDLAEFIPSPSSNLERAFAYKPRRVDFKNCLKDPKELNSSTTGEKQSNYKQNQSQHLQNLQSADDFLASDSDYDYDFHLLDEIAPSKDDGIEKNENRTMDETYSNYMDLESSSDFHDQICPNDFDSISSFSDEHEKDDCKKKKARDLNEEIDQILNNSSHQEMDYMSWSPLEPTIDSHIQDRFVKSSLRQGSYQPQRPPSLDASAHKTEQGTKVFNCHDYRAQGVFNQKHNRSFGSAPNSMDTTLQKALSNNLTSNKLAVSLKTNTTSSTLYNKKPHKRAFKTLMQPPPQTPGARDFITATSYAVDVAQIRETARKSVIPCSPFLTNISKGTNWACKGVNALKEVPFKEKYGVALGNLDALNGGNRRARISVSKDRGFDQHKLENTDTNPSWSGNYSTRSLGKLDGSTIEHSNREVLVNTARSTSVDNAIVSSRPIKTQHASQILSAEKDQRNPRLTNEVSMVLNSSVSGCCSSNISLNTTVSAFDVDRHTASCSNDHMKKDIESKKNIAGSFTVNWFVKDKREDLDEDNFDFCEE